MPSLCGVGFWGYESAAASLAFYVILGVNSGPCVWEASPLQTEPSPRTQVPVSKRQALYRLSHLPSPQFVFCFHGISDIAFLFISFTSPSEGNELSGWTTYPDLSASRSGGPMLTRGYTFWAVLLTLMNPHYSGFQIQVCSGQIQRLKKGALGKTGLNIQEQWYLLPEDRLCVCQLSLFCYLSSLGCSVVPTSSHLCEFLPFTLLFGGHNWFKVWSLKRYL